MQAQRTHGDSQQQRMAFLPQSDQFHARRSRSLHVHSEQRGRQSCGSVRRGDHRRCRSRADWRLEEQYKMSPKKCFSVPIHSRVHITWDMVLMIIILIGSILIVFLVCLVIVCYRKSDSGSISVSATNHITKQAPQSNGAVPSSTTTQATTTTPNGYMYQVVTDGTTQLHSPEHNSLIYNQLIDPNLHHANHTPSRIAAQQHGNSLVQRQPANGLLTANAHLKSVKFKHDDRSSTSTSPNSNSLNIAQDDSGYLDSDSPRLLCPLHQSFNDDSSHLRTVHVRAPLARPEAADASVDAELRMPLRETALWFAFCTDLTIVVYINASQCRFAVRICFVQVTTKIIHDIMQWTHWMDSLYVGRLFETYEHC